MSSHLQTSPGTQRSKKVPAVAHQVPGSDLDMASNDDMLLSAFDLTILPIFGENVGRSHTEAPRRYQHQHRSGTYCGQWAHAYEHRVRWNLYLATSTAQPYPGNMRPAAMVISPTINAWLLFPVIVSTRPFSPSSCLPTSMAPPSIFGTSTGTTTASISAHPMYPVWGTLVVH
ncbi:uncharacterized protein GLRG_03415 [Colletotrichum graminicola M1.001]|uniref:Uncharacterized protein n=1 Tax=Colletotrichum graminicola (strain M1.001 / M2 / FGSC 10212) TaxID=645133 RepID=E3QC36_COLGM|nr:uncharacterized protein GLRG_03415 [Colletotrichum graminicola M1.001]EFQ28271.1 hypothetical protein GLRG_03415 [Colletotrichum graminicola M1.001]